MKTFKIVVRVKSWEYNITNRPSETEVKMKTAKKVILICIVAAMLLTALAACLPFMGNTKREYDEPEDLQIEITATTIKFIDDYTQYCANGEVLEYRIGDDGAWQDAPLFEGLTPNTKYDVYVRVKGNSKYKASKAHAQEATTSKLSQSAPNVTYQQVEKTITIQDNSDLEYSFDEGVTYSSQNQHTYTEKGDKKVYVRYKEADDKFAGEVQIINIKITDYYSGTGTETDPFLILTASHFLAMKDEKSRNSYFKLMNDLDFSGKVFYPAQIGGCVFDGNNHKIQNIDLENDDDTSYVGVFAHVGTIKNITLDNIDVKFSCTANSAYPCVALLAATAEAVENCKAAGEIKVVNEKMYTGAVIGGLVARISVLGGNNNRYVVTDSCVDVKITYDSQNGNNTGVKVGGVLGEYINAIYDSKENSVAISKCMANVDIMVINAMGSSQVAGLVGSNMPGVIENSYAIGSISTEGSGSSMNMGGLIAQTEIDSAIYDNRFGNASIESCYSIVNLYADRTSQNVNIGGISSLLKGYSQNFVKNCLFAGAISVSESGKTAYLDSLATSNLSNYTSENCYCVNTLTAPVEIGKTVAVSADIVKTVAWQRETLRFSADVWNFTEGQYPTLK